MKSSTSDTFLMGACVMFDKFTTMDHLNEKIPYFFIEEAALLSRGNSFVLIVATMYSSDTNFNLFLNMVIYGYTCTMNPTILGEKIDLEA